MNIEIIILAIVQGIAEFLPISSSSHLIIFREVLNIGSFITDDIELIFDLALHIGTLFALILVFFKDFLNIVIDFFKRRNNILINIVIATIPATVFGLLFKEGLNSIRKNLIIISIFLIVVGIILYIVDKKSKMEKTIEDITFIDAIIIGFAQVFSLIPGVSRSGSTITGGRYIKLKREDAAKFSFYLSVPVVVGATLLEIIKKDTISLIVLNSKIFILGSLVSFVIGVLVIRPLLNYIKKNDYKIFMYYRVALGVFVLLNILLK